jgi:hypothetical protein
MIIARQRRRKLFSIIIHVNITRQGPWSLMAMPAHLVASLAVICKGTSRPVGSTCIDRGAAGQQRNFWIAPPLVNFFVPQLGCGWSDLGTHTFAHLCPSADSHKNFNPSSDL